MKKRMLAKSSNQLMLPWQSSGGSRCGMKCHQTRLSSALKKRSSTLKTEEIGEDNPFEGEDE